jgi:hypothetical protein
VDKGMKGGEAESVIANAIFTRYPSFLIKEFALENQSKKIASGFL